MPDTPSPLNDPAHVLAAIVESQLAQIDQAMQSALGAPALRVFYPDSYSDPFVAELGSVREDRVRLQADLANERRSGEDFIHHPWGAAKICAELRLDEQTIAAALLHDIGKLARFHRSDEVADAVRDRCPARGEPLEVGR